MLDEASWTVVASGDQGYEEWQPKFAAIRDVAEVVGHLDEIKSPIDLEEITTDFPYFSSLTGLDFPPLYNLGDFEELSSDFLHASSEPVDDTVPGMSFNRA